ncbi:hypothetical protein SDC9_192056 [bioreactor metagenome]|uniref:Uncharacterized protein n=1 Tax=bioreactor metagenome TaxID=1076179 RepID=A0A645HZL4_9ZZZZ
MDFNHHGVFVSFFPTYRLHQPPLNIPAIFRFVPELFGNHDFDFIGDMRVHIGQLNLFFGFQVQHRNFGNIGCVAPAQRHHFAIFAEIIRKNLTFALGNLVNLLGFHVHIIDMGGTMIMCLKVDARSAFIKDKTVSTVAHAAIGSAGISNGNIKIRREDVLRRFTAVGRCMINFSMGSTGKFAVAAGKD